MKKLLTLLIISLSLQSFAQCFTKIAAGGDHSHGIKTDGTLWSWGYNSLGQLGDGTSIDKKVPTQIGMATNWQSISAGIEHTLAIKIDGTLWAWGRNDDGMLGDGTKLSKQKPIQIGTSTNWQSISAGDFNSVAKKIDGTHLDCPQKVRHYLGVFLWKEKSSMIMRLSLNA